MGVGLTDVRLTGVGLTGLSQEMKHPELDSSIQNYEFYLPSKKIEMLNARLNAWWLW